MSEQGRYGQVPIVKIIRDFNDLRKAIRNHDSEATEAAWERCERWLGFVIGSASRGEKGKTMQHETDYLIHKSGRGWYRPEAKGYTLNADEAGRFTHSDAIAYSHPNGPDGPRDGLTFQHESEIQKGADCGKDLRIHDLILERDMLLSAREELSEALSEATAQIETLKAQLRGAENAADTLARLGP
jgi:hypothetical protein